MISELDLNIYQALFQQKKLTEKYLGKVKFDWIYSEVHYTAECTVGVPFDLFDKTIVGILLVDEVLSIEEIGDILGMNVIHNPEKQQYRDDAEFDILRMALDNLYQYKMIEIGDTSYSSCRLTSIGKEYAQKGRKFKIESDKPFFLVYDHISQNHIEAQLLFKNLKGKNQLSLISDFDFLNEALMKQMAVKQASEVYDEQKGNSFTNPTIDQNKSRSFSLNLFVALLYDLESSAIRLLAYEPTTKTINEYFSKWLNDKRLEGIIEQFQNENTAESSLSILPQDYVQTLTKGQKDFEIEVTNNAENAFIIAKQTNQGLDYIDVEYFWNNLTEFICGENTENFVFIPNTNQLIIKKLENLPIKQQATLFVCLQETGDEDIDNKIEELCNEFETNTESVFAEISEDITSFECLVLSSTGTVCLELNDFVFDIQGETVKKTFIHKYNRSLDEGRRKILHTKIQFAEIHLPFLYEQLLKTASEEIDTNSIHKKTILSFQSLDKKAHVFTDLQESEEILQQIFQIEQKKNEFIASLKEKHQAQLQSELKHLLTDFDKQEFSKLGPLQEFNSKLQTLQSELFEDYIDLQREVVDFRNKIDEEVKRIKDDILAKTYIIDTNVFIEEPEIITKIESKHYIALTLTVIDELDKLKTKEKTKETKDITYNERFKINE